MNSLHLNSVRRNSYSSLMKLCGFAVLAVFLLLSTAGRAAELNAEVDRETVIDGEAIVLYITGIDIPTLPDISALNREFRIIQSGQSSSQTIVNGKSSRRNTIRLELQPKNLGSSVIPSFTSGAVSSDAIPIEVVARGTPGVEPRDKVFAELSVDNSTPYVQEQVLLSLKVFDDGTLSSVDPVLSGNSEYQVEQLTSAREQLVERNGVQYRVYNYRYALFPQQSGNITIDTIRIPASVRDPGYGGNLILFNTPSRRVELTSNSISLSVKPRAENNTASWWLPVKALDLKYQWSGDITAAKAGEPYTLTVEIHANGATSTQLPEIPVPDVEGLKIYVDNPEFGSRVDGNNLTSVRQEKWSVIPSRSGQLSLPEVVIKWWDLKTDTEQEAVMPAQTLIVAGSSTAADMAQESVGAESAGAPSADEPSASANASEPMDETVAMLETTQSTDSAAPINALSARESATGRFVPSYWIWLAVAAATAWLATLFAWWLSSAKRGNEVQTSVVKANSDSGKSLANLRSLAKTDDASAYSKAVVEWGRSQWPDDPVHNLPEVGVRLGNPQLTETMRQLDHQRYSVSQSSDQAGGSVTDQPLSLKQIQSELENSLRQQTADKPSRNPDALPQLS